MLSFFRLKPPAPAPLPSPTLILCQMLAQRLLAIPLTPSPTARINQWTHIPDTTFRVMSACYRRKNEAEGIFVYENQWKGVSVMHGDTQLTLSAEDSLILAHAYADHMWLRYQLHRSQEEERRQLAALDAIGSLLHVPATNFG